MISTVSNGPIQSDLQKNRQLPSSLQSNNNLKINDDKKIQIRKKYVITFLCLIFAIIFAAVVSYIVYAVLVFNNFINLKNDNFKNQTSKDARSWFNHDTGCGLQKYIPFMPNARIVNGYEANPNSWPWAVSIGYAGPKLNLPHACGGTLINKRFIVTATHCVKADQVYSLIGKPKLDDPRFTSIERMLRIYIGIHDRLKDVNDRNTFYAMKIISHPNFDDNTFENDISLIQLDRDVEFSDTVNSLCLNSDAYLKPSENVVAIGWGFQYGTAKKASRYLMQVSLTVQSEGTCEIAYVKKSQFCAGNLYPKKDTCNGDSGGPIMKYIDNRWTLVGIVSNGDADCEGVGVYTIVPLYYNWLLKNAQY